MIPPGGFLGKHLDAELHPIMPWRRRYSSVLFIDDWKDDWGGVLRLEGYGDVTPKKNMLITFPTDGVWHSVSTVSTIATNRRTIALFAWSLTSRVNGLRSAKFESTGPS